MKYRTISRTVGCPASVALAGALLLLLMTSKWGLGVSPDSVTYIDAARQLVASQGFVRMLPDGNLQAVTHYPPLYSVLLAMLGSGGADILVVGRWLNAILLGLNVWLVGVILQHYTGSLWTSLAGALFTLASTVILGIHTMAWSEPLFLFLGVGGIFLLTRYLETEKEVRLVLAALALGLAFLTRYVGGALIVAGGLGLLLLDRAAFMRRSAHLALFGLLSILPMTLFVARNLSISGRAASRTVGLHPFNWSHLRQMWATFRSWLVPGSDRFQLSPYQDMLIGVAAFCTLGLLAVSAIILLRKRLEQRNGQPVRDILVRTPMLMFIALVTYLLLLAVSISLFDDYTRLDDRILSPVFVMALICILYIVHRLYEAFDEAEWATAKHGLTVAVVALAALYLVTAVVWGVYAYRNGRGFSSKLWQHPAISAYVDELPAATPIFSNSPIAVYVLIGRRPYPLSLQEEGDLMRYRAALEQGDLAASGFGDEALLVYFDVTVQNTPRHVDAVWAEQQPITAASLTDIFALDSQLSGTNWAIYRVAEK